MDEYASGGTCRHMVRTGTKETRQKASVLVFATGAIIDSCAVVKPPEMYFVLENFILPLLTNV